MSAHLFTRVETEYGTFTVLTKIRYLVFFNMPRSTVMPFKATKFVATPGLMVQFNTSDSVVLSEWHEMLCAMVRNGLFPLLSGVFRTGFFPYPEDKKQLAQYVKRFI
jgi:membrane-associated HD superfamily phosphohydrolase